MTTNSCEELLKECTRVQERENACSEKIKKIGRELEEINHVLQHIIMKNSKLSMQIDYKEGDHPFVTLYTLPEEIVVELQRILEKKLEEIEKILDKCEKCWEL